MRKCTILWFGAITTGWRGTTVSFFFLVFYEFSNISVLEHPNAVSHILRCGRRDTEYQGTDDGQKFGDKLSILVPLGKNGYGDVTNETIALEFVCQNSCVSGINRRSTAIIFTLEGVK